MTAPAEMSAGPHPGGAEAADSGVGVETWELPTDAPVIGASRPVVARAPAPGHALRVPDVSLDAWTTGRDRVAAASVIGTAHVATGVCRQDGYAVCRDAAGRVVVAVADGLGSRPASHLGARAFCEEVVRLAGAGAELGPAQLIVAAAGRAARMVADGYGIPPRDAACVAVLAVFDEHRCELARVGDCTAFTPRGGDFAELFSPDGGFVNQVTATLLGEETTCVDTATVVAPPVVLLASDGLANDIRTSGMVRDWLSARLAGPVGAFAIGNALRYRRQGSHDDRTAVVVWRGGGAVPGGPVDGAVTDRSSAGGSSPGGG